MKNKITAIFLSAVLAVSSAVPAFSAASSLTDNNDIYVDDVLIDFGGIEPIKTDDYTYVPIRPVFEQFFNVDWDAETKTVIITDGNSTFELYTSTGDIYVNGEEYNAIWYLSDKYIVHNSAIYVQKIILAMLIRDISEALGAEIPYNSNDVFAGIIKIYTYEYMQNNFKNMVEGFPLPQALYNYLSPDIKENIYFDDKYGVLLDMTDNTGYDELVSAVNELYQAQEEFISHYDTGLYEFSEDNLSDEDNNYMGALWKLMYQLAIDLDGMEDKSFMSDSFGTVFNNTNVTIDDNLTDIQSLDAITEAYKSDDIKTVTVNKKLSPLAKIAAVDTERLTQNLDENDKESVNDALMLLTLIGGYAGYLKEYDPELSDAAEKFDFLFSADE